MAAGQCAEGGRGDDEGTVVPDFGCDGAEFLREVDMTSKGESDNEAAFHPAEEQSIRTKRK